MPRFHLIFGGHIRSFLHLAHDMMKHVFYMEQRDSDGEWRPRNVHNGPLRKALELFQRDAEAGGIAVADWKAVPRSFEPNTETYGEHWNL